MSKPYVILVGMDFTELANRALREAFELASRRELSEVHVLCVVPDASSQPRHGLSSYWTTAEESVRDGVFESLRAHVQTHLDELVAEQRGVRVPDRVMSHVCVAIPAQGILQIAEELDASVIVLGRHGHRDGAAGLGSVAESTVRDASCPVLVIPLSMRPPERWTMPPISRSLAPAARSEAHRPSLRP